MSKRKTAHRPTAPARLAQRAVPTRRTLVLLESGLLVGLAEGLMEDFIHRYSISPYLKALLLMVGVLGVFALAIRIIEPIVRGTLKAVSKLDQGGGAMGRIALHVVILFLIFVCYVRVFFPNIK
ncbi:MAG: hypothetical protein Q8922_05205 [Bacteroidota bacterium]|nr:hypothetical protein [Bacteroidota bacterium]MDP4231901.1 hypothetical protein [Bacteroidota bacterium]MDP4241392.1 hypothetical protein [Bacteroidota bacterium]MDP4287315.1 hypothetical protein [Bacteroidota bacterium]